MPNENKASTGSSILNLVAITRALVNKMDRKGFFSEDELAGYRTAIAEAEQAAHQRVTDILYVLSLNDNGTEITVFGTPDDRVKFLSKQDNCIDDFYTLDVQPGGGIDFCLANVGTDQ